MKNESVDDKKASPIQQSAVWRYMDRFDYNSAQCKICGMVRKCIAGNTSNLINHIFKHHQKEAQIVREPISMRKLHKEERKTFLDKVNWENMQKKDSVLDINDLTDILWQSSDIREVVNNDLQLKVEDFNSEEFNVDTNEEVPKTLNNSQLITRLDDEQVITFDPDMVLKKYNHSLAWQFFSFRGTKELGPDKSAVYCSLFSLSYNHKTSSTSNLIDQLKAVHWEEFHAAKVKESNKTVLTEVASTEDLNTDYKTIENVVESIETNLEEILSIEDSNNEEEEFKHEEEEDNRVKIFNPAVVLDKTPKSLCWNLFFFKGTEDGAVRTRVYCSLCPKRGGSFLYSGSTTNLTGHLRVNHQDELKEAEMNRLDGQMAGAEEMDRLEKELQMETGPIQEDDSTLESKGHLKDTGHTSPVWMFMENLRGGQARCQLCGRIFSKSTGVLREHILKGHSETKQALILRKAIKERIATNKKLFSETTLPLLNI